MKRVFLLALVLATGARADIKLPSIFGSHMVLQQEAKIPVWGWADPGELVQVSLGSKQMRTEADAKGAWRVEFDALPANTPPTTLTVAGRTAVSFDDIAIGEVWLASGQSNMGFRVADSVNGKDVIAKADDPMLRIFEVANRPGIRPKTVGEGFWHVVKGDNITNSSAVAYFFGQQLREKLNRPVGVITPSWGGQPIETFMSKEALQKIPGTEEKLAAIAKLEAVFPQDPDGQKAAMDDFGKRMHDWDTNVNHPWIEAEQKWQKDRDAAIAAKQPVPPEPPQRAEVPRSPDGEAGDYTTVYNGMIAPYVGFPIRGAIWYQGESNSGDTQAQYDALLRGMIEDWRAKWGSDFAFLVVGLANNGGRSPTPIDNGWAEVRGAQIAVTSTLPKTGLAQAIEIGSGNNIHPPDKLDVGKRLVATALHVAYNQDMPFDGPRFASMAVEGNKIRVKFTHAEGLKLAASPYISNDQQVDNVALPLDQPLGFEIAGADKKWVNAKAQIDGQDMLVWADAVAQPAAVRFAWANNPQVNEYNKDGFPAVPFRTQDWKVNP